MPVLGTIQNIVSQMCHKHLPRSIGETYLDSAINCNNVVTFKEINISGPNRVLPGLHAHVRAVGDIGIKLLQASHGIPAMVDKHLVLGIGRITGIHDESR